MEVDKYADTLTSPGETVANQIAATPNPWVTRIFALLFGILAFGVGLRMLANWLDMSHMTQRATHSAEFGI